MYSWNDGAYLMHHGIKGQKWGIRRYQNFDGSYTKAGLERYGRSVERYEKKKKAYNDIRKDKTAARYQKMYAQAKMLESKNQMQKDYRHLASDKAADKGKVRYARGERIRENKRIVKLVNNLSLGSMVAAEYLKDFGIISPKAATIAQYTALGTAAAGNVWGLISEIGNKEIRAYYAHSSNY